MTGPSFIPPAGGRNASASRSASVAFAICLVSVLGTVATLNFLVDPYGIYTPDLVEPITFDSHRELVSLLLEMDPKPQVLVLGSSRVGKVPPRYLQRRLSVPTFNANLNAARAETLLAYFRFALDVLPRPPRLLLLGLETTSFSDVAPVDEQLVANSALARRVPEFVGLRRRLPIWSQLLSSYQLENSIRSLRLAYTKAYLEPVFRFAADGRRLWRDESPEAIGVEAVARQLPDIAAQLLDQYRYFDSLDGERLAAFECIVDICAEYGTELVVYMTPLHPSLVAELEAAPNYAARQNDLRRFLLSAGRREKFTFVDLSRIDDFGGDAGDWLDPLHHGESTGRRIVDALLAARGR